MKQKLRTLCWIFGVHFFISTFTFGGGYVVVPMVRRYFVQKKGYFNEEELLNMAAIAQSSPGAISVNLLGLAGYRTAGTIGLIVGCISAVLPPLILLSVISIGYQAFASNIFVAAVLKGMQAGVAALIADVVVDMCKAVFQLKSWLLTAMIPLCFVGGFVLNLNVALILIGCCIACIIRTAMWVRKQRKTKT